MRPNTKDNSAISFYNEVLVAERIKARLSIITDIVTDTKNTKLHLHAAKQHIAQIQFVAADGKLVYNQTNTIAVGNSVLDLQVQHLPAGIYTLVVYVSDGEIITKRFVK